MTIGEVLRYFWVPNSRNSYKGAQCIDLERQDVFAFSERDFEGVPWWTFFDAKTKKLVYSESGSEKEGSTKVSFSINSWRPRYTFENSEFPSCVSASV